MPDAPEMDIDYVAGLARIALTPEEKVAFSRQLGVVLTYIEKLKEADIAGIEPSAHAFDVYNVWSADEPRPALPVEEALRNAPQVRDNMIAVPKVVE